MDDDDGNKRDRSSSEDDVANVSTSSNKRACLRSYGRLSRASENSRVEEGKQNTEEEEDDDPDDAPYDDEDDEEGEGNSKDEVEGDDDNELQVAASQEDEGNSGDEDLAEISDGELAEMRASQVPKPAPLCAERGTKFDKQVVDMIDKGCIQLGLTQPIKEMVKCTPWSALAEKNLEAACLLTFNDLVVDKTAQVTDARSNVVTLQQVLAGDFDLSGLDDNEKKEFEERQMAFKRDVNKGLGRSEANTRIEYGNLFIPRAYDQGRGWKEVYTSDEVKLSRKTNIEQIKNALLTENPSQNDTVGNNMFGFENSFITDETHDRTAYVSSKMPASKNNNTTKERNSSMIGTSVVAVKAAMTEYIQQKPELKKHHALLSNPSKRTACYLTGMNVQRIFKNRSKDLDHIRWLDRVGKEPKMEDMPTFDDLRKRVVHAMDHYMNRKDEEGNVKPKGTFSGEYAVQWALSEDRELNGLPASDGDEGGDGEEDSEEKDKVIRQKAASYVGTGMQDNPAGETEDNEEDVASKQFEVFPMNVEAVFDYTDEGIDEGAEKLLKAFLKDKYLCGRPTDDNHPKPEVKRKVLEGVQVEGKSAEVIGIEHAFHPDTVAGVLRIYYDPQEEVEFCRDEFKFFRSCVTDEEEPGENGCKPSFQMGKDAAARYYKAFKAHPVEKKLKQVAENMLRATLKAKYGKKTDAFLNQLGVNVAELEHRTGFSYHGDANITNTKHDELGDDDYKGGETKAPLPSRDMMPVVTTVFTGPLGAHNIEQENYELTWKELKSMKILTSLKTAHNYVHIQYACQGVSVHGGKPIKLEIGPFTWRLTITFRGYCNPAVNPDAWKARCEHANIASQPYLIGDSKEEIVYGILTKIENPHTQGRSAEASENDFTLKQQHQEQKKKPLTKRTARLPDNERLSHKTNRDVYPSCKKDSWPKDNVGSLQELVPIMQFRQPAVDLYMSSQFQLMLVSKKTILRVLNYPHNDFTKPPVIYHSVTVLQSASQGMQLAKQMTYYQTAAMVRCANMSWVQQSRPIIHSKFHRGLSSICLHTKYRLDVTSAIKLLKGEGSHICIYGSGGAALSATQAGPNPKKGFSSESEAAANSASPQTESSKVNSALTSAVERQQVVGLWMTPDLVVKLAGEHFKATGPGTTLYLGDFVCEKQETLPPSTITEIRKEYGPETVTTLGEAKKHPYLSFRTCSHKRITLRRVEAVSDKMRTEYKKLYKSDPNDIKVLTVVASDTDRAIFSLNGKKRQLAEELCAGTGPTKVVQHMKRHFDQQVQPLLKDLRSLSSTTIEVETNPIRRLDCKAWTKHLRAFCDKNPYLGQNPYVGDAETKYALKCISIAEFIDFQVALGATGFARMLGKSLSTPEGSEHPLMVPLPPDELKAAGSLLRLFASPQLIRTYDVTVCLNGKLSSQPLPSLERRNIAQDAITAVISHLCMRTGAAGNFVKQHPGTDLRKLLSDEKTVSKYADYMKRACSDPTVSPRKLTITQYDNQIPGELKRSSAAMASFIRNFAKIAPNLEDSVLAPGKTRKQYVVGLAEVMSTVSGIPPSEFYFLSQHIVETIAESNDEEGRFGEVTIFDVHMGPGSRMGLAALGLPWRRPNKFQEEDGDNYHPMSDYMHEEEAECWMHRMKNLPANKLACMGLYKDNEGEIRVTLTARKVTYLHLEHALCKLYLFFKRKTPTALVTENPQLHFSHCHPAKFNCVALDPKTLQARKGGTLDDIAKKAVKSFKELRDFKMPWKMLFQSEYRELLGKDCIGKEAYDSPFDPYFDQDRFENDPRAKQRNLKQAREDMQKIVRMHMKSPTESENHWAAVENAYGMERPFSSVPDYYYSLRDDDHY